MFRFAELLIILFILYLIVNLLRYMFVKSGGSDKLRESGIFGLSSSWLEAEEKKKQSEEKRKD